MRAGWKNEEGGMGMDFQRLMCLIILCQINGKEQIMLKQCWLKRQTSLQIPRRIALCVQSVYISDACRLQLSRCCGDSLVLKPAHMLTGVHNMMSMAGSQTVTMVLANRPMCIQTGMHKPWHAFRAQATKTCGPNEKDK
eukprot:scaffold35520_cov18-Tisochrysis_lutea.AAC.1